MRRRQFASIIGLLQAAAIVTAVFSVVTIFDHLHRHIEMFSHFRLQYLVISAMLALLFAVFRQRNYALLMLIIAAINTVPVAPWYLSAATVASSSDARITVMHANVLGSNDDYARVVALIAAEQPDLVFLQEIHNGWARTIVDLSPDYPYGRFEPRDDNFGIAVLSRRPFTTITSIDSPPHGFPTLIAAVQLGASELTFVSTHAMPPIGRDAVNSRNQQLADAASIVAALHGPGVLIGDLNISMWSHHYRKMIADNGLRDSRHGFGVIPTWPTFLPFAKIPIDHCLVTAEVSVIDVRSGPNIGSDHLPLLVTLGL